MVFAAAKKSKGTVVPFLFVNPYVYGVKKVRAFYDEYGFKGIKLHPVLDGYYPKGDILGDILTFCEKRKVIVAIHTGWGPLGDPKWSADLAKEFRKVRFVLLHMKDKSIIQKATGQRNVFVETSYAESTKVVEQAVRKIGARSILFGSDYPYGNASNSLRLINRANISLKEKRAILGENAARLLS